MFFLLAGIPFGFFALRVILKIITGLSILNTLMGWSDSLSDYYNARVKGTDVTDGHLETHLFGVEVHAVQIDMDELGIERDPSKKRMDYNGQEIKEKAGCIKNIDTVIKRLEDKGNIIGKVCYLLDKKNKTIIFIDRHNKETVAIEIPLERTDLDGAKQAEWNEKIGKILAMDPKGAALNESEIDSIDELLTGFGADTCKARTKAAEENAKSFVQSSDVAVEDKEKVEYLLKALQEMQAVQAQAVEKQSIAQGEIDKIKAGDFGLVDQARSLMASFDSTMDKYVDRAVTALGQGFDRKDDGFFEYVTYLVEVTKFEAGMAADREIAIQKAQAQAEHDGVAVMSSNGTEQEGWEQEAWHQQGLAGKLEDYKKELENNLKSLKEEQAEIPVAAQKPEGIGKPVFENLFNSNSAKNLAKNQEQTKQAIQNRKKQAIPISLFELFKRFFSSIFRPTAHMSIRDLLLGDKVNSLGDNAVDTQFEREKKLTQQKRELSAKIKQAKARIETVKAIQGQVAELEKEVSKETVAVYNSIGKVKDDNAALDEKVKDKRRVLGKLSDTIKPLDVIGVSVEENSKKLSQPEDARKQQSTWSGLEQTEQDELFQLSKTYDDEHTRLKEQLFSLSAQVTDISNLTEMQKLALKEQQKQLEKVDGANETMVPLAVRSVVNSFCEAAGTAISSIQASVATASAKVDEAKKKVDVAVKEAVVNTAMALLHEEASVSIFYTSNLAGFEPKLGEIAVAYDPSSKQFSYKYLGDNGIELKIVNNMGQEDIKSLLIFLSNQTPENKAAILATPAFSKFKEAHDAVLAVRQVDIDLKKAADKAKIESKLGAVDLTQSGDVIMGELMDDLSAEEGQTLGQRLRSLIGASNGNGAARLKELKTALDQLQVQKKVIDELTLSITQQDKTLDEIEENAAEASQLKQTLESYQKGQLQNQVRLSAIRVGTAMNQLKLSMKEAKVESESNQFFTKEDKNKLRQAINQAKQTANGVGIERIFAMLDDGTAVGKAVSEQLQAEFENIDWSNISDAQADSIVNRVENYVNAGLISVLDEIESLMSDVGVVVNDAKTAIGLQSEHEGAANVLQNKIDHAVTVYEKIGKQEIAVRTVTQEAQGRKQKATEMLDEIPKLVQSSLSRKDEAIEAARLQAVARVQNHAERAEKSATNAQKNAKLLMDKESAAQFVAAAEQAMVEANDCILTEGLEVSLSLDKSEAAAKKAEAAVEAVIALVVTEAQRDADQIRQNTERAKIALDTAKNSLDLIFDVEDKSRKQGLVDFSTMMAIRLNTASQFLRQCEQSMQAAEENLRDAEIAERTLQDDKLNLEKLRSEITLALQNTEVFTADSEAMATEIGKIVEKSLRDHNALEVEGEISHLRTRKLKFTESNQAAVKYESVLISSLIPAEQRIAAEMRLRLKKALVVSREEIQKIQGAQVNDFATELRKAYSTGDYNTISRLYNDVCRTGEDVNKRYSSVMMALAVEQACYMLLAKTEIFETIHRYLKDEISVEEAQKIIAIQEEKVKYAENVVKNLSLFDEQGRQLYGSEVFSQLSSDLKCVKSDIAVYKQSLLSSEVKVKPVEEEKKNDNPTTVELVSTDIAEVSSSNSSAAKPVQKKSSGGIFSFFKKEESKPTPDTGLEDLESPKPRRGFISAAMGAITAFIADASTWVTALFESGGIGFL